MERSDPRLEAILEGIPYLPCGISPEDWKEVVCPLLETCCGAIPKKDLVIGRTYHGECRNAEEAVWNGEQFEYQRTKFGHTYTEKINHYEDDDGYDLFIPISPSKR